MLLQRADKSRLAKGFVQESERPAFATERSRALNPISRQSWHVVIPDITHAAISLHTSIYDMPRLEYYLLDLEREPRPEEVTGRGGANGLICIQPAHRPPSEASVQASGRGHQCAQDLDQVCCLTRPVSACAISDVGTTPACVGLNQRAAHELAPVQQICVGGGAISVVSVHQWWVEVQHVA